MDNLAEGTASAPVTVSPGDYVITITGDAANGPGEDVKFSGPATVPSGVNASAVAHLDTSANPTITAFANDTSEIEAGNARLTVRHVAAAPAVDVLANGGALFSDLSNPNEDKADVPADTCSVAVVAAGEVDPVPVFGPAEVPLAAGANTIVYAWGNLIAEEQVPLDVIVQTIEGLGGAPGGVPSGTAPIAEEGLPTWAAGAMALGALGIAASGAAIARSRSRS